MKRELRRYIHELGRTIEDGWSNSGPMCSRAEWTMRPRIRGSQSRLPSGERARCLRPKSAFYSLAFERPRKVDTHNRSTGVRRLQQPAPTIGAFLSSTHFHDATYIGASSEGIATSRYWYLELAQQLTLFGGPTRKSIHARSAQCSNDVRKRKDEAGMYDVSAA